MSVTSGLMHVQLGSIEPLMASVFAGTPRYLEVQVGTDPAMTPRIQFTSVAFAYQAENAEALDGLDSAAFWMLGGNAGTT